MRRTVRYVAWCAAVIVFGSAAFAKEPPEQAPAWLPTQASEIDTTLFPTIDFAPDTTIVQDTSMVFALEIGSRLYTDWKEEQKMRIGDRVFIGDTEYAAAVTGFLSDFRLVDGRPVSASSEMKNPAAKIVTYKEGAAVDSTWAFLNFPPHFSPKAFFTFRLLSINGLGPGGVAAPSGEGTSAADAAHGSHEH
ncbi:MAG: hypothetical protein ACKVU1_17280 [bacterium]